MIDLAIFAAAAALTAVRDSYPDLSPDSSTLIFHSNRSGKTAIWKASRDGSNPQLLFDGGDAGTEPVTPRWSPDGKQIVFAMKPRGAIGESESDIYVIAADGSRLRRLTEAPGGDSHPHWSGDGKRILFNSARATPEPKDEWSRQWHDVYSMAADGSDVRRLSDCRSVCTYPVASPDGRRIAYRRVIDSPGASWELEARPRNSEVFVANADGSDPINVSNSDAYDGWPIWSPDSQWIAFSSNRDRVRATGQIYLVRPDGTGLKRITDGPFSHAQPSFTADGKAVLAYRLIESDSEIGQIVSLPLDSAQ